MVSGFASVSICGAGEGGFSALSSFRHEKRRNARTGSKMIWRIRRNILILPVIQEEIMAKG
jgi:hypothetical protein